MASRKQTTGRAMPELRQVEEPRGLLPFLRVLWPDVRSQIDYRVPIRAAIHPAERKETLAGHRRK